MTIEGRFLLSYNDCAMIRQLYCADGIVIRSYQRINNLKQHCEKHCEKGARFDELLIANYDINARAEMQPKQLDILDIAAAEDETLETWRLVESGGGDESL